MRTKPLRGGLFSTALGFKFWILVTDLSPTVSYDGNDSLSLDEGENSIRF
jgi:hypothetical protein